MIVTDTSTGGLRKGRSAKITPKITLRDGENRNWHNRKRGGTEGSPDRAGMRLSMISPLFRCSKCLARTTAFCGAMRSASELGALETARLGTRKISAGETVFHQQDDVDKVYIVLSGWVYLYHLLDDDRRQITRFAMRGDSFGVIAPGRHRVDFGAEAMTDTTICVLSNSQIAGLRERHPAFCDSLFEQIEADEYAMMDLLTTVGRRNAAERVAFLLNFIYQRALSRGLADESGSVQFPASQIVLADALGLTAVHVNRVLRSLRESGILQLSRGRLTIQSRERLAGLLHISETCPAHRHGREPTHRVGTG